MGKPIILGPNGLPLPNQDGPMAEFGRDTRAISELTRDEWAEVRRNVDIAFYRAIIASPVLGRALSSICETKVILTESFAFMGGKEELRTCGVDGKKLYIHPLFALHMPKKILTGVLMHELYHMLLQHPARGIGYDPALANVAMDFCVNLQVNDAALEQQKMDPQMVSTDHYHRLKWYIPVEEGFMLSERFRTPEKQPMQWEQIYQLLLNEMTPEQKQRVASGEGLGMADVAKFGNQPDQHQTWRPGNRPADGDGQTNNAPIDQRLIDGYIRDAAASMDESSFRGNVPAGLRRTVDEILNPPLPWQQMLSMYTEPVPGDVSWIPGDTRFDDPMPWMTFVEDIAYIGVGLDTSGSMGEAELAGCLSQIRSMIGGYPSLRGRAYCWDAEVHDRLDVHDWHDQGVPRQVGGGGGTSMIPQFRVLEEEDLVEKCKVFIAFTDFYIDVDAWKDYVFPKLTSGEYPFDVIVVICNQVEHKLPAHPRVRYTKFRVRDQA